MKLTVEKSVRNSVFAENVVSRLVQSVSVRQEGLQIIEAQIAELNKNAERERQKIKELKMAIDQLMDFGMKK